MNRFFITIAMLSQLLFVASCKDKEDDKEETPVPDIVITLKSNTVKNLPANPTDGTGTGHYTFFSFKNNAIVPVSDSATTKWDVGLLGTTIIVNAGTSGPGAAGVQVLTGLYDDLAEAPSEGYKIDNKSSIPPYAIPTGSGNGWYNYNSTTHVISAIPGRVLVFRTADAKYAKVEIISYYKDMPANPTSETIARYYSFRYTYQDDGSRVLK